MKILLYSLLVLHPIMAFCQDAEVQQQRAKGQAAFDRGDYQAMGRAFESLSRSPDAAYMDAVWHGHALHLAGNWPAASNALQRAIGLAAERLQELDQQMGPEVEDDATDEGPRTGPVADWKQNRDRQRERIQDDWPMLVLLAGQVQLVQLEDPEAAVKTLSRGLRFAPEADSLDKLTEAAQAALSDPPPRPHPLWFKLMMPIATQRALAFAHEKLGDMAAAADCWTRVHLCHLAYEVGMARVDADHLVEIVSRVSAEQRRPWHELVLKHSGTHRKLNFQAFDYQEQLTQDARNPFRVVAKLEGFQMTKLGPSRASLAKLPDGRWIMAYTGGDEFQARIFAICDDNRGWLRPGTIDGDRVTWSEPVQIGLPLGSSLLARDADRVLLPTGPIGNGAAPVLLAASVAKMVESSLPKGLEFLRPYPKLHGLSLGMTKPQFLEIIKRQELTTRKTVDGEKFTYHVSLGDGHMLIVMFDKNAKCSGIQRIRGEQPVESQTDAPLGSVLDRAVSPHFKNAPLIDVLEKICTAAGVELELDGVGLKSEGFTKTMQVTIDADNVTLREALTWVLKPFGKLSFTLDKKQIFVSTKQRVEARDKAIAQVEQPGADDRQTQTRKLREPAFVLPDHLNVMAVQFVGDDKELVSVATQSTVTIRTWDVDKKKFKCEVKLDGGKHSNLFLTGQLRLSADGRRLAAIVSGQVGVWDTATGKLVKMLTLPQELEHGFLRGLAGTPDLSLIVVGRTPGLSGFSPPHAHAIVWDVATGKVLQTVRHDNAIQVQSVALSRDGKWLATGGQEAGTSVWEVISGKRLLALPNSNPDRKHPDPEVRGPGASQVLCLAFSPNGRQLAIGDMLSVKLVDAKSGELLHQLDAPYRFGRSGLRFSQDGQLLARIGTDKVVPIWSAKTGQRMVELHTESHDSAFSADGRWFAVGLTDKEYALAVWQLRDEATAVQGVGNAASDQTGELANAAVADESTSLADALRDFNTENKRRKRGLDQPPLTEEEVLAAIKRTDWKRDVPGASEREFAAFKAVAETRRLPKGSEIEVLMGMKPDTAPVPRPFAPPTQPF